MKVEIITVGDELLIGQVVDTNSAWMGQQLNAIGASVVQITTVTDGAEHLKETINSARQRADIILITGGLGPTSDDRTKETLAAYFSMDLVEHPLALENVTAFFARLGRGVDELNRLQALMPMGCYVLPNPYGTACGMWFEEDGLILVSMPGVPSEMKYIMEESVLPRLATMAEDVIIHKTVHVVGMGESTIAEKLRYWESALPKCISLAYLPDLHLVRLRLSGMGENREELEALMDREVEKLEGLLGSVILGVGDIKLAEVVSELLRRQKKTVVTAESCTGGALASMITALSGSSDIYLGSILSYSNGVKVAQLGVSLESLAQYGAVSQQAVEEMAQGARERLEADYAISVSGIAGPGGGTEEKPVGTVWFGLATPEGIFSQKYSLAGNRAQNIQQSAMIGLDMLRLYLLQK